MKNNRLFIILTLLLALCGGCTGYNYYDPYGYYLIDEYIYDKPYNYRTANKQRQQGHKELIKKLDSINKTLKQQAFDARWDRLDHDSERFRRNLWDY